MIFRGYIPTPHAIAVYASQPLSPVATQHSLPSGRYSLLGPDFHRLDRTSLPGALIRSPHRRGRAATAGTLSREPISSGSRTSPPPWRVWSPNGAFFPPYGVLTSGQDRVEFGRCNK